MGSVIAVVIALIGGFVQSDGTRTGRRSTSWFRGHFWLATIVVLTVQYVGEAAGHIYFWLADNNTKP